MSRRHSLVLGLVFGLVFALIVLLRAREGASTAKLTARRPPGSVLSRISSCISSGSRSQQQPSQPLARNAAENGFCTPLISNRVLAIFYLCGGESILRSRKMQEKLGLHYLLQNKVLLTGWKV